MSDVTSVFVIENSFDMLHDNTRMQISLEYRVVMGFSPYI